MLTVLLRLITNVSICKVRASATTVSIIDADESTSEGLASLLETIGVSVKTYASAEDFLADPNTSQHACLIAEINLPGISGLELLKILKKRNRSTPIILLTWENDVSVAVRSLQAGAVDFFEKPFVEHSFLHRVNQILFNDS